MINPAPFILKDRNTRVGFTYTVTFPVNSMNGFGFSVDHSGTIATVTAMNITSYTLSKNGLAVMPPFSVVKGDILMIENVVKINPANPSNFILRAPKFAEQNVQITALTQVDATRKHLFVVNYSDQTVSVIDTSTDTVESTIALPTTGVGKGYEFQCIAYRSADDYMYVFGYQRVCKIDANPGSPTFKNVYSRDGILNESSVLSPPGGNAYPFTMAVYDYVNDRMYLGQTRFQTTSRWAFGVSLVDTFSGVGNPSGIFIPNSNFISSGNAILGKVTNGVTSSWYIDGNYNASIKGSYKSATNTFFAGTPVVREFNADTLEQVRQFAGTGSTGQTSFPQANGNAIYSPFYNLVIALTYEFGGGNIYVIDTNTNTTVGSFVRTNKEANDTIARSMVYGAYAKKYYFLGNGNSPVTRVHKLNPQLWIDNGKVALTDMIDGFITVGNVSMMDGESINADGRRYQNTAMAFNHLIPS